MREAAYRQRVHEIIEVISKRTGNPKPTAVQDKSPPDKIDPVFLYGFAAGLCAATVAVFIAIVMSNYQPGSLDEISKLAENNSPGIVASLPHPGHRWEEMRERFTNAQARAERQEAIKSWLEMNWGWCVWAIVVPGAILVLSNKSVKRGTRV